MFARFAAGARLCEPQRVDSIGTPKLAPIPVLPATRCGSQTRAPGLGQPAQFIFHAEKLNEIPLFPSKFVGDP